MAYVIQAWDFEALVPPGDAPPFFHTTERGLENPEGDCVTTIRLSWFKRDRKNESEGWCWWGRLLSAALDAGLDFEMVYAQSGVLRRDAFRLLRHEAPVAGERLEARRAFVATLATGRRPDAVVSPSCQHRVHIIDDDYMSNEEYDRNLADLTGMTIDEYALSDDRD